MYVPLFDTYCFKLTNINSALLVDYTKLPDSSARISLPILSRAITSYLSRNSAVA